MIDLKVERDFSGIDSDLLLGEALSRGLITEKAMGDLAALGAQVTIDHLSDQYDQALAALGDLGFGEEDDIPPFEQIRDGLSPSTMEWLTQRRRAGHRDELVISPRVSTIGLVGYNSRPGLITRFDSKQSEGDKCTVEIMAWDHFSDRDILHDNGATEEFTTGIMLGDITDPRDLAIGVNIHDEPGLVYTDMPTNEQRAALEEEQTRESEQGREIMTANISQVVTVDASRRLADVPRLDPGQPGYTHTRLIHYPATLVSQRGEQVPTVRHFWGRRLSLGSTYHNDIYGAPYDGVRRVLLVSP